jgi:membrane associated rhomboid family serine protease
VIPIRVEKPIFVPPVMTWLIIAINVGVFLWMKGLGDDGFHRATWEYALIPRNLLAEDVTVLMYGGDPIAAIAPDAEPIAYPGYAVERLRVLPTREGPRWHYITPSRGPRALDEVPQKLPAWLTILTAMFMHAGWVHLLGNMWFLHVFGSSVEDTLGRVRYLLFYLLCGLVAFAAQIAHDPQSVIISLGASGAIAGVMGAFAVRFPGAQVLTIIPIILWTMGHIPAWIFMLIYIGQQIFMSVAHAEDSGGVAWWAHIGGFAGGYFLIRWFPVAKAWKSVFSRSRHDPFG